LQILPPNLRGAKLYYSMMIGLNLWQKPQQVRCDGTLREPNYASQAILSCGGGKRRGRGGEFPHLSLCGNGSLSVSHCSRIRGAGGDISGQSGIANLLARRDLQIRTHPEMSRRRR
jgi:hypothetical protein